MLILVPITALYHHDVDGIPDERELIHINPLSVATLRQIGPSVMEIERHGRDETIIAETTVEAFRAAVMAAYRQHYYEGFGPPDPPTSTSTQ